MRITISQITPQIRFVYFHETKIAKIFKDDIHKIGDYIKFPDNFTESDYDGYVKK